MNTTARSTFARTSVEAFNDADRAQSVEGPFRDDDHPLWWVLAIALISLLCWAWLALPVDQLLSML